CARDPNYQDDYRYYLGLTGHFAFW
nr:immunoglobulin heavy chain junction region [Macaca mulatta]MOV54908.1 immunoglobulin heavy chain junction region [Macaca mulatta]MOV56239.1 immunoglobulin heavy chain junction region [Macaca mulatta]MOV59285.1 immunoglobulin heavy chain junction region [Macaca mulatta]MOV59333.1 immunoglobulin heavy chain junction region [Macaca mulatta]